MAQPPGVPPEQWERRKDDGTRRLLGEVQVELREAMGQVRDMAGQVRDLETAFEESQKNAVTWKQILGMACLFAVTVCGTCWRLTEAARSDAFALVKQQRQDFETANKEIRKEVAEFRSEAWKDNRGLYEYLRTKRRQERFEKPPKEGP